MKPAEIVRSNDRARCTIRLFHPKGNIITLEMVRAARGALETLRHESGIKLLTIEGQGPDFSFGASVPEHAPGAIDEALPEMHRLVVDLLAYPAVTAAAVRGRCLGGGFELALACDLIFAEEGSQLGLPEIALGVFAPAASAILPLRVGATRAARALLTGEPRPASDWRDWGLVEDIAPAGALDAAIDRWFDRHLAPRSALALAYAAEAARLGLREHVDRLLPELERVYLYRLMRSQDAAEGVAAFLEKRTPHWCDR